MYFRTVCHAFSRVGTQRDWQRYRGTYRSCHFGGVIKFVHCMKKKGLFVSTLGGQQLIYMDLYITLECGINLLHVGLYSMPVVCVLQSNRTDLRIGSCVWGMHTYTVHTLTHTYICA